LEGVLANVEAMAAEVDGVLANVEALAAAGV
jgi:hypothetical protein